MGWFKDMFGAEEVQPVRVSREVIRDDYSKLTDLVKQLTESIETTNASRKKAEQTVQVVNEIMAQLAVATAKRDEAVNVLQESQAATQSIIDSIGSCKLELGL